MKILQDTKGIMVIIKVAFCFSILLVVYGIMRAVQVLYFGEDLWGELLMPLLLIGFGAWNLYEASRLRRKCLECDRLEAEVAEKVNVIEAAEGYRFRQQRELAKAVATVRRLYRETR